MTLRRRPERVPRVPARGPRPVARGWRRHLAIHLGPGQPPGPSRYRLSERGQARRAVRSPGRRVPEAGTGSSGGSGDLRRARSTDARDHDRAWLSLHEPYSSRQSPGHEARGAGATPVMVFDLLDAPSCMDKADHHGGTCPRVQRDGAPHRACRASGVAAERRAQPYTRRAERDRRWT